MPNPLPDDLPTAPAKPAARPPVTAHEPAPKAVAITDPKEWLPGRLLNGRYRIVKKLGVGGMGVVYLCDDLLLRRNVALKTLFAHRQLTDDDLELFCREVALAHMVNHANIARTYDIGRADGVYFLTMEYLQGRTLVRRLQQGGPLTAREVRELAVPLCEGLRAAHKAGVLHRDLKPDNVMLVQDERRAVIMDFGIAVAMEGPRETGTEGSSDPSPWAVTSAGRGTPAYMAPEQWDRESGDARTDIYALGVILFLCLCEQLPFKAGTPTEVGEKHRHQPPPDVAAMVPGVDRDLARLIRDCLSKDPKDRPQTVDDVLKRLRRWHVRRSWVLRVALTSVVAGLLCFGAGVLVWDVAQRAVIREMRPALTRLAELVAERIDPDDLDKVQTPQDIDGAAFRRVHAVLDHFKARDPEISFMYTMQLGSQREKYVFVVDLDPRDKDKDGDGVIEPSERGSPPGLVYDGATMPEMAQTLLTGQPQADAEFRADAWGVTLSGYAPVLRNGEPTRYFVGVDGRNDQLEALRAKLAVTLAFVWVLAVAAYAWLMRADRRWKLVLGKVPIGPDVEMVAVRLWRGQRGRVEK
jgi:predicted Ser/Thr protein kinase